MAAKALNGQDGPHHLDDACQTLAAQLRAGRPARAEEHFARHPALATDSEAALELIYTEYLARLEGGEDSTPDGWYERFPQFRTELEELFQLHDLLYDDSTASQIQNASVLTRLGQGGPQGWSGLSNRFGPYHLLDCLNTGVMAVVYRARDMRNGTVVALKIVRDGWLNPSSLARFRQEIAVARRLSHPAIIRVLDFGQVGEQWYLAMRYAEGGSLAAHLDRYSANPRAAVTLVAQIAHALHYAHQRGVFHRDLKPANILLDKAGQPLVADFGLAKLQEGTAALTQSGERIGSPAYMAPEQIQGLRQEIGRRTDVWALGVVLYELLTGRRPFEADNHLALFHQILHADPVLPSQRNPNVDAELEALCLHCLAKAPAQRPPSAEVLAQALESWAQGERRSLSPPSCLERFCQALGRLGRNAAVLALGTLLGCLSVCLATVVPHEPVKQAVPRDRDWLNAALTDLEQGLPVQLVEQTGLPRWFRWQDQLGTLELLSPNEPVACLRPLVAYRPTLLELLPHPVRDSYHFRAEVREVEGENATPTFGVFFGFRSSPTASGLVFWYMEVRFNDLWTTPAPGKQERLNGLHLNAARYTSRPRHGLTCQLPHQMLKPVPGAWRTVEVDVTPTEFQVHWDGAFVGRHSWQDVRRRFGITEPWLGDNQGSLGIVSCGSAVAVRNVTIRPMRVMPPRRGIPGG